MAAFSLASGASEIITVTATIDTPGPFNNVVSVLAAEADPNNANNTDNTFNGGNADPLADVAVDKVLSTSPPDAVGQTITYTITVTNNGPSAAFKIMVSDTPANLTINSVSSTSCSGFPCTIPALGPNNGEVITVTATINNPGIFNNAASAVANEPDPNVSNNTDNTGNSGNAGAQADLIVSKMLDTAGPYFAGQPVSYTITVTNGGPQPATNVNVTDTPSNLSITSVTGGCLSLPCTIASLPFPGMATINVTATIIEAGPFDNVASANGAETDPNTLNNTDDSGNGGNAAASADVSIAKNLDTFGPYFTGQSVTYTIIVANAGPFTATNVSVTDTPSNLTITSVAGACTPFSPCTIASIGPNSDASIYVEATIAAAGAFDNVVTATAAEHDPDTSDNSDNKNNGGNATSEADVSLTKILETVGTYNVGQTITHTIVVANAGPLPATNINVTDTPTNLTITGVSGACATLPCIIASILPGANTSMIVTATIDSVGAFDNSATATPSETDLDLSNNTDSLDNGGTTDPAADISIVKSFVTPQPYRQADDITMDLVVTNNGPNRANSIVVKDAPVGLTVLSMSGGGCANFVFNPSPFPGNGTCTIPSLASGASVTVTVTAHINNPGQFLNTATANAAGFDPNTNNNTSSINTVATSSRTSPSPRPSTPLVRSSPVSRSATRSWP